MSSAASAAGGGRRAALVGAALALATLAVFAPACANDFVNYDDPEYVTENDHVQAGLTADSVRWAFTTTRLVNWHPLTWLSFELDAQLFGLRPAGFHLTNVLLHAANALLLFLALRALTGALWRSAFVAALFALHPLHVESVAWVSERKDTLSTLFAMLALLAYAGYARRPGPGRYLLVAALFALGLLAKSMLVTLPLVLLLLDWWPLGRLRLAPAPLGRRLLEKVPLLVLAAASSAVTLVAQRQGGEANPLGAMPLRLENAAIAYVAYLGRMVVPVGLAPFYPFPTQLYPFWQVAGALALLAAVSAGCLLLARNAPYLLVGWLWYLGTLVPVLGVVQVLGTHAMADRYTYLPLVGVFLMVVWGVADLAARWRVPAALPAGLGVAALAALAAVTWVQIGYWHDSRTLWRHTLDVTANNFVAEMNMASAVSGEPEEAERHLRAALRIEPDSAQAYTALGALLDAEGRTSEAIACYRRSLELEPGQSATRARLALALARAGDLEGAIDELRETIRRDPGCADAYHDLAFALARAQRLDEALAMCRECVRLQPRNPKYRRSYAALLAQNGEMGAAAAQAREADRLAHRPP